MTEITRRDLLKRTGALGGAAMLTDWVSSSHAEARLAQDASKAGTALAARRAQLAATPITTTRLTNLITMFSGPGGNVVVRNGDEGKVVIDTFVRGALGGLKERIDALGRAPIVTVIATHWHFDHTDNIEGFRQMGAEVLAHTNTQRRLSEAHDLLGLHFAPVAAAAKPTKTFGQTAHLTFDLPTSEEYIDMEHIPPAHTDSDIYVYFFMGDVLHLGDTFFNGMYPVIDFGTGGSVSGMIAATEQALKRSNPQTRIVPGHGLVGDRTALMRYRDMLTMVRDRVQALKKTGRTEREVVAAKPTADLDDAWGTGVMAPDAFVSTVYNAL